MCGSADVKGAIYTCPRCGWRGYEPACSRHIEWHRQQDIVQKSRDDEEMHARGYHDGAPLQGCPDCERLRNRTG